jgi:hypothetical protein
MPGADIETVRRSQPRTSQKRSLPRRLRRGSPGRRRCQGSAASASWRGLSLTSTRERVRSRLKPPAGAESTWQARDGGVGQGERDRGPRCAPTEADGGWSSTRKVPCASSHTRLSFRIDQERNLEWRVAAPEATSGARARPCAARCPVAGSSIGPGAQAPRHGGDHHRRSDEV